MISIFVQSLSYEQINYSRMFIAVLVKGIEKMVLSKQLSLEVLSIPVNELLDFFNVIQEAFLIQKDSFRNLLLQKCFSSLQNVMYELNHRKIAFST